MVQAIPLRRHFPVDRDRRAGSGGSGPGRSVRSDAATSGNSE